MQAVSCCLKCLLEQRWGASWGKCTWVCNIHGFGGFFDAHEVAPWTEMALEDKGQGQGCVQQKALGDLGIKTGRDVLRADLTCKPDLWV